MDRAQVKYRGFEREQFGTSEEYAGYEVLGSLSLFDPLGHKIGRVEKLFFSRYGEPQYVRVRLGFFFARHVLIPVQDVALDRTARSLTLK